MLQEALIGAQGLFVGVPAWECHWTLSNIGTEAWFTYAGDTIVKHRDGGMDCAIYAESNFGMLLDVEMFPCKCKKNPKHWPQQASRSFSVLC